MRDEDNEEPFAACWGVWKPPVPPCLVLAAPSCAMDPCEPAKASAGYTCQSHPCAWGAHTAPADSSPSQRRLGEVVMKGINAGTQEKKKLFCCVEDICEWYCLLLPTAFFWNRFAFFRREWSEVMKSAQSCKASNLAQPDPSWGKTVPRFENANILGVCNNTMLKQELQIVLKSRRNEFESEFYKFPRTP